MLDSFLTVKGCGDAIQGRRPGLTLGSQGDAGPSSTFRILETEVDAQKIAPEWRKKQAFLPLRQTNGCRIPSSPAEMNSQGAFPKPARLRLSA